MKPDFFFVLENATWPALLVDAASTILRANQAAVKLFGPALEGSTPLLAAIWSPENTSAPEEFLAHWERSPTTITALKYKVKGGGNLVKATSICACPSNESKLFIFQLFPETERNGEARGLSQEANLHKQKLDCALQLARSVALDFNNALTSVLGHTSLLLSKTEPNHPWRKSLLEVEKAAARAAEITADLAGFSRQERDTRTQNAGNLNLILQRCVEAFRNSLSQPVEWQLQLERRLFAVKFDEAKIQQALMRILENAGEALAEHGRIGVQTKNLELAAATQDRNVKLAPGAYVCVEISDNGLGIDPEVLPRVFEPFFTTKRKPHRGLGLAWVYGIVTNHGGGVAVSSQAGAGTNVRIYMPAEKSIISDNTVFIRNLTGDQTILMVDDEDLLLTMGDTILSSYGYTVLTANSGQRALEIISKHDKPIDLLITDLVMPAMSGRELVEHVHRLSPGTRIMCASGYVRAPGPRENLAYLQKPFTSQELLMKVKELLSPTPTMVD